MTDEFARIGSEQPGDDAETFLGSILGKQHERMLLGVPAPDLDARMHRQVQRAMRLWAPYLASTASSRADECAAGLSPRSRSPSAP